VSLSFLVRRRFCLFLRPLFGLRGRLRSTITVIYSLLHSTIKGTKLLDCNAIMCLFKHKEGAIIYEATKSLTSLTNLILTLVFVLILCRATSGPSTQGKFKKVIDSPMNYSFQLIGQSNSRTGFMYRILLQLSALFNVDHWRYHGGLVG
jgi:hypothetical protein